MNRAEFIKTIMELYPNTFHVDNVNQYQGWINRYKSALPEDWNFDKLLQAFDKDWKSTVIPPHPSFFREYKADVKPPKKEEFIPMTAEEIRESREGYKKFKESLKKLVEEKSL